MGMDPAPRVTLLLQSLSNSASRCYWIRRLCNWTTGSLRKESTRKPITLEPGGTTDLTPSTLVIAILRPRAPIRVRLAKSKGFYVLTAMSLAG